MADKIKYEVTIVVEVEETGDDDWNEADARSIARDTLSRVVEGVTEAHLEGVYTSEVA